MEIQLNDAKCKSLKFKAPVKLASDESGNGFLIEAYTGEVVERWWGSLAIDVNGINAKQQIPIFLNHSSDQIVGYSSRTYAENSFYVEGKFSGVTDEAKKTRALMEEGFPWQASIGVRPVVVMSLEKDGEMIVNGKTLNGPAEVWLESEVFETSFVPLGADSNTSVSRLSQFEEAEAPQGAKHKQNRGEEMKEITLEKLKEDAPELLETIRTDAKQEGAEKERERIQSVLAQSMPGHEALIKKLAFDGKTTGPETAVQILAAEKKIRENAKEDLKEDGIDPVDNAPPAEPKPKDPTEETFESFADLKEEFGDWETYKAYKDAEDAGQVKTLKKGSK